MKNFKGIKHYLGLTGGMWFTPEFIFQRGPGRPPKRVPRVPMVQGDLFDVGKDETVMVRAGK